jgi:hypothetical protein
MRKSLLVLLLIPLVLFTVVSCEGDVFTAISDYMGMTQGNVLIENDIVTLDTSQVDTVTTTVTTLGSGTTDPSEEEIEDLQEVLDTVLASPQKTEALKEEMQTPADVTQETEDRLEEFLPKDELGNVVDDLTQGDILAAELVAAFMDDVTDDGTGDPIDFTALTDEEKDVLISEALQVIEVVKAISPVGAVSIDNIVSGFLDDLFASRATERGLVDEGLTAEQAAEIEEVMVYVRPIANSLIDAIGTTGEGDDREILLSGLRTLINSFSIMRVSYENMAPAIIPGVTTMELNELINYALSVAFTEAIVFFESYNDVTPKYVGVDELKAILDEILPRIGVPVAEGDEAPGFIDEYSWDFMVEDYFASAEFETRFDTVASTLLALANAVGDQTLIDYIEDGIAEADLMFAGDEGGDE